MTLSLRSVTGSALLRRWRLCPCWSAISAGSLERLKLYLYGCSYTLGSWTATAHRLQELHLDTYTMTAWIPLDGLTSLQRLLLDAEEWQLGAAVALPASLTRLCISCHEAGEMPAQARGRGSKGSCVNRTIPASCFAATGLQ